MTGARSISLMLCALACTCAAGPKPASESTPAAASAPARAAEDCGAGQLPRVTEKSFAELRLFLERAARGTVAVDWDGARAQVLPACQLDGRYFEIPGGGTTRFAGTNRLIFRPDELGADCARATHLVASYLLTTPQTLQGILIPLPCPPNTSPERAAGCIARGSTGKERRLKARELLKAHGPDGSRSDAGKALEVYALIPDHYQGLNFIASLNADCSLRAQAAWAVQGYVTKADKDDRPMSVLKGADQRPAPIQFAAHGAPVESCRERPAFMRCFPGQFDPGGEATFTGVPGAAR